VRQRSSFKMKGRRMSGSKCFVTGLISLVLILMPDPAPAAENSGAEVKVYEGTIELDSYEFSGRELEPPLFKSSSIGGDYPLPQFTGPYKPGGPKPATYRAIFLENEYLKLTVVPDFGGRVYSLFDKVAGREVFYKNDVLKFSGVNAKGAWPVGNIELTGPHDMHMLTIYGEPLWFTKVLRHQDGSASLVMSNIDPYYRMKVNFTATLVPGLRAMGLKIFCYNTRDQRKPFMFWVNGSTHVTEGTRFIYPMTRTIGHTTAEVADWPFYNGVDYSWIKNNKHMLGVFGIDIYDNFLGAYDYKLDYGTFRFADRRVVQGMKTWTWGAGNYAGRIEHNYTDNAGAYIEIQSGRYVWDGHYEWLDPHRVEGWSEWWFPVAGIGGFTTTSLDLALNLEVKADPKGKNSSVKIGLSPNRAMPKAKIIISAGSGEILNATADLAPGKPFNRLIERIAADSAGLARMRVTVADSAGRVALDWRRPDENPGRKEYTGFTRVLEKPQRTPGQMSVEELVLDAETKIKELHTESGASLLREALSRDSGYSKAHLELGILHYEEGRTDSAVAHLNQVIDRDPYADKAYYYLALALMETGDTLKAERSLYYIPPVSAWFSQREYMLGRIACHRGETDQAERHLAEAVRNNGYHLSARNLLAVLYRDQGRKEEASAQIAVVREIDPTNRWAQAESYFLRGRDQDRRELSSLLGGQSQEAVELSIPYRLLGRFDEALAILSLVEEENHDPFGTPPIFYYTKAFCLKASGKQEEASVYYKKGRLAWGSLDRFPFRPESVKPLAEAVAFDPADVTARFHLGCLLYSLGRKDEAISQWEKGVEAAPDNFSLQRTLGMAYLEGGYGIDKTAEHLEAAIELNPDHVRTFTDLSDLYSRSGYFDRQLALLNKALERSPKDDYIIEGLITTNLVKGDYEQVDSLIRSHVFAQRHRSYGLRDKYRYLRYGFGSRAYLSGKYSEALRQFEQALYPPGSLGADDFQYQSAPRVHYYIGLALEKMGKTTEARASFERCVSGWEQLSGDRDSWNSDNFYMVLALEKLGKTDQAERLLGSMEHFADSQMDSKYSRWRAEANFLLGLVRKKQGDYGQAQKSFETAVQIMPDMLGPRFELRGDVVDPLPSELRTGMR